MSHERDDKCMSHRVDSVAYLADAGEIWPREPGQRWIEGWDRGEWSAVIRITWREESEVTDAS